MGSLFHGLERPEGPRAPGSAGAATLDRAAAPVGGDANDLRSPADSNAVDIEPAKAHPVAAAAPKAHPVAAAAPAKTPAKGTAARPTAPASGGAATRALVIGCGALARELLEVTARIPGLEIACLPPDLHNRPDGIPGAVRDRIATARRDGFERIFVAYADCGTGGLLEPVLAEAGVERLPGAHCYEVFAGSAAFAALADAEPGTFWLTDFLARNFERLVIRGLGIDRHPELQATYFAHYTRVVFLSQTEDPDLLVLARRAADRLGLAFEHRPTGTANLAAPILAFAASSLGPTSGMPH
jgi:hypothetical protein